MRVPLHRSEPAVALAGLVPPPVGRPPLRTETVPGRRLSLGHPEAPLLRHPSFCLKSPAAAFLSARDDSDPFEPAGRLQLRLQCCPSSRCVTRRLLATRPWFCSTRDQMKTRSFRVCGAPTRCGLAGDRWWSQQFLMKRGHSCLGGRRNGFRFLGMWTTVVLSLS